MAHVQYASDGTTIVGVFANPQGFPTALLADNDPAVLAFLTPPPPPLSFLQFLALFTSAEQAAIVSSADAQVKLFVMSAAGAGAISLSNAMTVSGVNYAASIGLLTAPRATEILAGQAPS